MRKITKGNVTIKLWDVGGQPRFRSMWERYCRHVQAIVYVVDAADQDKIDESAKLLHDLVERPTLHTVPLLVLGNKNDLPNALATPDLKSRMRLQVRHCSLCVAESLLCVPGYCTVHASAGIVCNNAALVWKDSRLLVRRLTLALRTNEVAMQDLPCEEVAVYSISCKNQTNINLVLDWLIGHSKK